MKRNVGVSFAVPGKSPPFSGPTKAQQANREQWMHGSLNAALQVQASEPRVRPRGPGQALAV